MAGGGKRIGSGRKARWGEAAVPVRVPVSLVDEVKVFLDRKVGVLNATGKAKPDEPMQLWQAKRRKPQADLQDGLVICHECRHLSIAGRCLNAKAAGVPGNYLPVPNMLRRCEGYESDEL